MEFAVRVLILVGIVAATVLLLLLFHRAFQVFLVFFAAILLAIFLNGLAGWVQEHTRLSYGWSLGVVLLLLLGVAVLSGVLLVPRLSVQFEEISEQLPKAYDRLKGQFRQTAWGEQLMREMESSEAVPDSESLLKRVMGIFSTTLGALANFLIVLVVGIYMAARPQEMTEGFIKLIPIRRRDRMREVLHTLGFTLWGWLKGTLLAMFIIGTITTIGLTVLGISMALILGVFAGLLEFVPNIGPFIAGAPAVLLALVESPQKALWVVGLFVVVQSLEGYVLTPLVQKRIIDLPPVLTIMAQVTLGLLCGLFGLLLAVPLVAVLMVLVKMLYIEDLLGDRSIEVKGEAESKGKAREAGHEQHQKEAGRTERKDNAAS